ncbi:MAG: hypothetical protein KUG77_25115 [Nannocystaceae bacterium]|nr:hypothetical protein [Nannocystaceae bacterium]
MSVSRIACVDVPALPLQLLLGQQPQWQPYPCVVVRDDRPQGVILWANAHARRHRILPGMTFAAARSLSTELRAAVVEPHKIDEAVAKLHLTLCNFTPRVEPSTREPGVFWVDPSGMVPLYGSIEQWGNTLTEALRAAGWVASVVVGFHRYRAYALARTAGPRRMQVQPSPHIESRRAAKVPLSALGISPKLRDHLMVLGIRTLGSFLRLPAAELPTRFGSEATNLHALASDRWAPMQPRPLQDPVEGELQFEPPDGDHMRLLFGLKGKLHELVKQLATRHQALSMLHLQLKLDHAGTSDQYIEPAGPTLDVVSLLELVRLRLESITLPAPIEEVRLRLEGTDATTEQLALFRTQSQRDLDAANRAVARLRAAYGPESVTRATLRSAHLPEASYTWEPVQQIGFPSVTAPSEALPLCRRVLPRPLPLPARPRHEPEAWLGRRGTVASLDGPYRVSGGWWVRTVERDYYFAHTSTGETLWIFYDRPRRRWMLHGFVD